MNKLFTKTLAVFCAIVFSAFTGTDAVAQCQNDVSFGSVDASTLDNSVTTITTCNFYGDYATVTNVEAGSNFQFNLPEDGGYITVREGSFDGPVVTDGFVPINVNNASGADLFIHINGDASCSTASSCLTSTIQCLSCDGCLTLSPFATDDLSDQANAVVNQSFCNITNEYNTVTGVSAFETIEFTATNGAYIVVRSGTFDGPIVGEGFSPVQVNSGIGEDLFSHYFSDASCGLSGIGCILTTVQCTTCPFPDPEDGDCYNGNAFGGADLSDGNSEIIELANCAFSSEHSEVTGVPAGENILFTLENGNYITVREGTPNGPVVAQGFSPLTVFSASGANLYAHWSLDASCGAGGGCYDATVQCSTCPDCPDLGLNIGDPCDDGNPNTGNDIIVEGCSCVGEPVPVNNDPCNAITINCGSSVSGSTTTATESGLGSPSCTTGSLTDVFYKIFALPGNTYEVTVNGDDYDGVLVAYTGDCDGDLTEIACADDGLSSGVAETISFSVTTAQNVLIRTYDWSTTDGSFNLSVSCTLPNITCADATPITFGGDPVYGNNNGAGPSGPNMDCAFAGDGLQNVVWYTFFAPTNGTLIIETTFEEGVTDLIDTQIQLLDACGGEVIACSEDVLLSLLSRIELGCDEFEQGAQYYLQVDGYNGQTGTFRIETSSGPCPTPENDVCADATPLAVNLPGECPGNAVEGTTLGSNNEGEVGGAVCEPNNPDVFYSFNSGSFSNFNLGVSGITATDLVIGVYEECTGASIFCAVNPGGPVSLELTPETDYIVRVSTNLTFGIPGTFNICLQGVYDCPDLSANIGDSCDDGNPATDNDVVLPDCTCQGEFDCPELGLNIGDACDDGDPTTINDTVTPDCDCIGVATPANDLCENAQSLSVQDPGNCEGNGTIGTTQNATGSDPALFDCEPGEPDVFYTFNSGDNTQVTINLEAGTATDLVLSVFNTCSDADPILCSVGNSQSSTISVEPNTDYIVRVHTNLGFGDTGTFILCVEGVFECPVLEANVGDACDDGNSGTINDTVNADCECVGTPVDGALIVSFDVDCAESYTVELYEPGTANLVTTVSGSVSGSSFTATGLPAGTYDVFVKLNKHLKKGFADITISSGSTSISGGSFIPGDVTGNNSIGIADFSAFSAAYGTEDGEAGFNPSADLNCDDAISLPDFSIFSSNFGTDGEEPPL
jgi:hypothetical protein